MHKMTIATCTFMKMQVKFNLLFIKINNFHIHSNARLSWTMQSQTKACIVMWYLHSCGILCSKEW